MCVTLSECYCGVCLHLSWASELFLYRCRGCRSLGTVAWRSPSAPRTSHAPTPPGSEHTHTHPRYTHTHTHTHTHTRDESHLQQTFDPPTWSHDGRSEDTWKHPCGEQLRIPDTHTHTRWGNTLVTLNTCKRLQRLTSEHRPVFSAAVSCQVQSRRSRRRTWAWLRWWAPTCPYTAPGPPATHTHTHRSVRPSALSTHTAPSRSHLFSQRLLEAV